METKKLLSYRNIWMTIAIIGAVTFHMNPIGNNAAVHLFQKIGYGGVDIFLFASGIGCYYSYGRDHDPISFVKRRMLKILPMYFLALGIYFFRHESVTAVEKIANVLSYSFFGGFGHCFNWYIAMMWLTYILVPYVFDFINSGKKRVSRYAILFIIALLMGISFIGNDNMLIAFSRMPIFIVGMCMGDYLSSHEKINGYAILGMTLVSMVMMVMLVKLLDMYPDTAWSYGIYWFPYIVITPGLCFAISVVCMGISKVAALAKVLAVIGKVIGENTLAIYLAENLGAYVSGLLGYEWDTIEHYNMSKIVIIPLAIIIAVFGHTFNYIYKKYTSSKVKENTNV
ncbi:MAG: acyltransferase [Lachnospiraceae bacterium]|nr:acyltransferase [Lachnospiraceae bacterium]